jgi:ER-bound oxygenase mpaB/B'/Rubber oxygenase, catalytic domain
LALSTQREVRTDQVEKICELRNDFYRNQWITYAYWRISQRLRKRIGANASWCTFSTWSSRTVGANLRLENSGRRVDELIKDKDSSVDEHDSRLFLELQYRVSTRDDGAAQRALALGNRLIFHEIGFAMIDFLEWADKHDDPDDGSWERYRETITPYEASDLFPAADVEQLRGGLECCYQAKYANTDDQKAELVLRGNLLLGAYEQWRVGPVLKVALDPWPGRLVRVIQADPHAAPELSLPGAGTPWALRHQSPVLRSLATQFAGGLTRLFMALDAPLFSCLVTPFRLGQGVPPHPGDGQRFPRALRNRNLKDLELKKLIGLYDRSGDIRLDEPDRPSDPALSAARNWTLFPDRMNFIVNLFRAGQQDDTMYRGLPDGDLRFLDLDLSDDNLDKLRQRGDSEVDDEIKKDLEESPLTPSDYLRELLTEEGLAQLRARYPGPQNLPAWKDDDLLDAGQKFFRDYRLEIASALFCGSLPMSYTAGKGARVLTTTAKLVSDAERRIAQTGMMLLAAMASDDPGELPLRPNTAAYKAAHGVRLFHGAVRCTILNTPELHWDQDELGVPVNQEDLIGTLAVFTEVVIASLDKMGVTCKVHHRDAYFHLWLVIGYLLGIDYDGLLRPQRHRHRPEGEPPLTYAEMQVLARAVFDRNAEPSPDGQELTAALLNATEGSLPFFLKDLPRALIRRLIGDESADTLGVPPPGVMRLVVAGLRPVNALISRYVHSNFLGGFANSVSRKLYTTWIADAGGKQPVWLVPRPIRAARRVRDEVIAQGRRLISWNVAGD